ncbi:MAG: acyl-CoA dehydrogenase family protein [Acidimicrobiales bacterium]
MDLTPSADQRRLQGEIRAWLAAHPPPPDLGGGAGAPDLAEEVARLRGWQQSLAGDRWVGVAWPEQFGGRGAGPAEHYLVTEELGRAGAPEMVGRIGINLVGPTLLAHGTEQQKDRWLHRILGAADLWCQLFSEPDAGSDLASLSTRAVKVPGGWRVGGQKVWTSYAQFADWGLCLARSDPEAPKRRGITCLVVDMHGEGVEVRPLVQLTGEAEFNQVFLADVFVPDDQQIGPTDEGWRVANSTLSHERGVNPRQLVIHMRLLENLLRTALDLGGFEDRELRRRLADAYVEVRLFQLHNMRTVSRLERGEHPGPEGSALKLYWSEMSKRLHETAMEVIGPAAPLWRDADGNPGSGEWQRSWLYYRASSIWAGTNEIQRNIIGERVLGLPR